MVSTISLQLLLTLSLLSPGGHDAASKPSSQPARAWQLRVWPTSILPCEPVWLKIVPADKTTRSAARTLAVRDRYVRLRVTGPGDKVEFAVVPVSSFWAGARWKEATDLVILVLVTLPQKEHILQQPGTYGVEVVDAADQVLSSPIAIEVRAPEKEELEAAASFRDSEIAGLILYPDEAPPTERLRRRLGSVAEHFPGLPYAQYARLFMLISDCQQQMRDRKNPRASGRHEYAHLSYRLDQATASLPSQQPIREQLLLLNVQIQLLLGNTQNAESLLATLDKEYPGGVSRYKRTALKTGLASQRSRASTGPDGVEEISSPTDGPNQRGR